MKKSIFVILLIIISVYRYSQTAKDYFEKGVAKGILKDYRGSILDISKAIELNSDYIDAYYIRGVSKGNLEDYRGAILDFSKAVELNPDYTEAYFECAISKVILNDY